MSSRCWKNGASRPAQCMVAINLQFIKKKKKVSAKHNKAKHNKISYAGTFIITCFEWYYNDLFVFLIGVHSLLPSVHRTEFSKDLVLHWQNSYKGQFYH